MTADSLSALINSLPQLPVDDLGTLLGKLVDATDWMVSAAVYISDYREVVLRPLFADTRPLVNEAVPVVGTIPGLAFSRQEAVRGSGGTSIWVPLTNRWRRFGVLRVEASREIGQAETSVALAASSLLAMVIDGAERATDVFALARRLEPLSLSAEMQWDLLPPMSIATRGATVAGRLEPAYDVGGDAFDYTVNGDTLHFAIFDPLGHDTRSALLASLAVGTYRHARRLEKPLEEIGAAIDHEVTQHFTYGCFVTGLLCEWNLRTGALSIRNAGHQPPLILRDGRVTQMSIPPHRPWGLYDEDLDEPTMPVHESMQAGDLILLFTDGVIEARGDRGTPLGVSGLSEHLVRESLGGHSVPELLRRVLDHATDSHRPEDDATVVLAEWRGQDSVPELGG